MWGTPAQAAISVKDDTGWALTLERPARRIVCLYGAFSELLLAMGLDRHLVGRTAADGHIPALQALPAVGTHMRPNAELIVALRPDVVIQLVGRKEAESISLELRRLGVPVLMFRMDSFENMFAVLQRLGVITGEEGRAAGLEKLYRTRLANVRAALTGAAQAKVFYEVRYPNLLGAGVDSIVNDILLHAGARNALATAGKVVRINEEELIRLNPDAYLIQQGPMNPAPSPLDSRAHYATLDVVRTGRVLVVEEAAFARPGPRAVDAVEQLARWLHPDIHISQQ